MDIEDIYWAAGFLDGEGSFYATSRKRSHQPIVQASQKYRPSLDKLQRLFGGKIYTVKHKGFTGGTIYLWMMYKSASGLMMTLYTLMSPYRQGQIEKALAAWKTVPSKRTGFANGTRR